MNTWVRVVFAAECEACPCCGEEPLCPQHGVHLADCECPGPTQEEEFDYRWQGDVMYARWKGPQA